VRITKRDKVHVPWLELGRMPMKYLDVNTIPKDFKMLDPSKLTKTMIGQLWDHWSERAKAKLPILIFIKAQEQDLGIRARYEEPSAGQKRIANAYVEVGSDDQASDVGPPPSKRPRLFKQPAVPEEQSPAANNSDRLKFLHSLSSEPSYKILLNGVLALPVSVSPFLLCMDSSNYSYI
jgi:hypothetical protein